MEDERLIARSFLLHVELDGVATIGARGQDVTVDVQGAADPDGIPHHWKPAKARAGLELRFHDLRHTAVALAIQAGAHPKTIQVRMGYSSVTVTLDRYGHLFPELDTDVAARLDETWKRHLVAVDGSARDTDRTRATRKRRRIGASEGANRTAPASPKPH